ncbi:MAG: TIGR03032 family protein [Gemmataceae bacterium]
MSENLTPETPAVEPLRSVHSTTLPKILAELQATLVVSTYQAGKLIFVRPDGAVANTHFRTFDAPMGIAHHGGKLAIGVRTGVWEFHNQPMVAPRLEPKNRHDAVFIPRWHHVSGQIAIHEIAYGSNNELWAVNTRFSCLCTFENSTSFVPRWRPPFITHYSATDRCHLNGFAMVDGAPRYATALGNTNSDGGWRPTKATGGVLMEIPSGQFLATGLSMPHSPRWYQGQLWVCESGRGSLSTVDPATGTLTDVALLPGFTRGLCFAGPFAFVGLSQVRETAVFSGIPITERLPESERRCGVWVVDIRNGQTVALLRFESGVQEVFAVQLLPHRWPELLNDFRDPHVESSYVLPDAALADVAIPPAPLPSGTE